MSAHNLHHQLEQADVFVPISGTTTRPTIMYGAGAPSDEVVIQEHVKDALIAVLGADVVDLVHPILGPSDGAFQAQDIVHKYLQ